MENTITIIISSGLVSAVVTALTIMFTLGKYKQKVDSSEGFLSKHSNKLSELSDRVSRLEGGVDRDRAHHSEYIRKQSPLSLTEKGKATLLDSSGKDYIDGNKDSLIEAIKTYHPKTAYDVQELSRKVIQEQSNDDKFNPIKNFVFQQGLSLDLVIDILGIYLRDIALSTLGFNITDIKD